MAVVLSHIGNPKNRTTAQKETIDHRRSHRLSVVSGGGFFCALAATVTVPEDEGDDCFGWSVSDASVSVAAAMLRLGLSRLLLWAMSRHDARPCASPLGRAPRYHYPHYSATSPHISEGAAADSYRLMFTYESDLSFFFWTWKSR